MNSVISTNARRSAAVALAMCITLLGAPGQADAAFTLGFEQAVYNAGVSSAVDVRVFLTETGTSFLNTEGLNGAGFVLSFNVAPRAISPAQATLITTNPGTDPTFDFVASSIVAATPTTTGTASLRFSQFLDPPLSSGGTSRVLLGTVRFQTGTANPDVTNLSLAIATPGDQFVTGTGRVLDSLITPGTGRIVIGTAAVPEPSTLILVASGVPILLGYRRAARLLRRPAA